MYRKVLLGAAFAAGALVASGAHAQITIAVAGPMTGDIAAFGQQMREGAEQAIKDVNAAGGVLGQQLVLQIYDDACVPAQAVTVANQIVSAGIPFVAGHFCSGSSIPSSSVYAEEGVVMISPGSTNPVLTDERPGPGIYRVCGRDDQQGAIDAAFLLDRFPDANIAIIHDKSAYGQGLAEQVKAELNAAGKTEVLFDSINAGDRDFQSLLGNIQAANATVLFLGGYYTEGGLIIRQAKERNMDLTLVGGDALLNDDFAAIAGPAGTGTLFSFGPDPALDPENKPVVDAMIAAGTPPEGYALYTYAAIQAWVQAATAAGTTDFDPVVTALDAGTFDTMLGDIQFDDKGDVDAPAFVMYEFQPDGTWKYAE